MVIGPQIYIVALLTIIYPILLIGAVLFIRHMGRKKMAADGERRRRPGLRRVLNALSAIPVVFIAAYITWQVLAYIKQHDVAVTADFYPLAGLVILYPLLMTLIILRLRYEGKKNGRSARVGGEERRQRFGLRRILTMLMILPVVILIGALLAKAIVGFD